MTAPARAKLLAAGAGVIAHPGGTLLAHLDRVHDLLLVLVGAIRAASVAPLLGRLRPWLSRLARRGCDGGLSGARARTAGPRCPR